MSKTVTYELTPVLYRRLLVSNSWDQYRPALVVAIICIVGVVAFSAYGFIVLGTEEIFVAWFPFLLCVLVWVFMIVWWLPYRLSNNKLNRNQYQKTTLTTSDEYLLLELENGLKEQIPYKHFVKSNVTDQFSIFWKNYIDIILVPKEAFTSDDEYNLFVQDVVPKLEI